MKNEKNNEKNAEDSPLVMAELPLVDELRNNRLMLRTIRLLEELDLVEETAKINKERADEIKEELGVIQSKAGLRGIQYHGLCFAEREMSGRKSLDKMLLIENGVEADTIEASMKTGKPFVERRFKNLNKEK